MTRLTTTCKLFFYVLPLVFSSCATLLNGPAQNVHIATSPAIRQVTVDKCIATDSSLAKGYGFNTYVAARSNQNMVVHLQLDSGTKTILLRPRNSFAFWYNIYGNYGIGMLVDKDNPKRYCYPAWNYFSIKDSAVCRSRFAPIRKGQVRLSLALPFANIFCLTSTEGQYYSGGVFGLEAGADYFYKTDRYISLAAGAATDRGLGEYFGKGYLNRGAVLYTSIRNNYVVGSFDLGYGISFSGLRWAVVPYGDTVDVHKAVNNTGLGLSLSAQYRFGNYFRMGVLYQPNLVTTNFSPAINYQHYISVSLIWKLPLNARE